MCCQNAVSFYSQQCTGHRLTDCLLQLLQLLCGQSEASLDLTNRLVFCSGKFLIFPQNLAPDRINTLPAIWSRAGAIHSLLRHPEQLAAERAQHAGKRQALGLNPASPLGFGSGAGGYGSPGGFFHGVKVHIYAIRVWSQGMEMCKLGAMQKFHSFDSPLSTTSYAALQSRCSVPRPLLSKHVQH